MVYYLLQEGYHRCWYGRYIAVEELFFVLTVLFVDLMEVKCQTKGQSLKFEYTKASMKAFFSGKPLYF